MTRIKKHPENNFTQTNRKTSSNLISWVRKNQQIFIQLIIKVTLEKKKMKKLQHIHRGEKGSNKRKVQRGYLLLAIWNAKVFIYMKTFILEIFKGSYNTY